MDKIIINGGNPLKGKVTLGGAKNAVLPIMAASLLVEGTTHISRVPDLRDTRTMIKLLELVGGKAHLEGNDLWIDSKHVNKPEAPYDLVKTMRA